MRLIKSLQSATTGQIIRIYRDSACNEYIVRVARQPLCDYFTDDKEDALATAQLMASPLPSNH
jgi:hypothetical protein